MAQRGVGPRRRTVRREEAKDDEQEQGTATLRLATYNIRTVVDRWWGGRKTMLLDTIRDVDADVMCLQEATAGGSPNSLVVSSAFDRQSKKLFVCHVLAYLTQFRIIGWLASWFFIRWPLDIISFLNELLLERVLGRFLHFLFESTIGQFAFLFAGTALCFGNATVVRPSIKILRHTFRVVGGWRAVQGVLLELPTSDGQTVTVAVGNVHLDSHPRNHLLRQRQAQATIRMLERMAPDADAMVIVGDFNMPPREPGYTMMYSPPAGFTSAHFATHGREPDKTFPTGLQAVSMDHGGDDLFDYIWYRGNITATRTDIIGHEAHPKDSTLYPSDHYGLVANLVIHTKA